MSVELVIREPKMCECDICVEVGDMSNSNTAGTVTIEYSIPGDKIKITKDVILGYPLITVRFSGIHKNGLNTSVNATVQSGLDSKNKKALLKFCSE